MAEPGPLPRPNGCLPEDAESDEDGVVRPESNSAAFRISVDLSEFFQQPASCFLWVPRPRDSRTVRWLARRLRRAAALRTRFCLLCGTHTLPPDEPLRLLRPGDTLRVVPVEHEWQRVFSFRGERVPCAPPAPPPKPKKRSKIHAAGAEALTLPLPQSKPPTQEASVPKAMPIPPPEPFLPLPKPKPTPSPALHKPQPALIMPSVQPTTPAPITKSPSRDEELQRVKRRALALLQEVEGEFTRQEEGGEGGEDEPDGAGEWMPAKKRRRRVRRRRPLPPVDFEQELVVPTIPASTHAPPELYLNSAIPTTPTSILAPCLPTPTVLAPPIPMPSLPTPPTPMPSLSVAPPPGPVVLRGETTPRLPRLVRALDTARSEDIVQPIQEQNAYTGPASLPQTTIQCS